MSRINTSVKQLLEINADNLKQRQFEALKQHGIDLLLHIVDLLRKNDFEGIRKFTFYSPAGDGMGSDNNCLDFDWSGDHEGTDIDSYLDYLEGLQPKRK